ncbi:MAG: hypothetical protein RLZZ338_3136 [Cyanobacteriota bacterium]
MVISQGLDQKPGFSPQTSPSFEVFGRNPVSYHRGRDQKPGFSPQTFRSVEVFPRNPVSPTGARSCLSETGFLTTGARSSIRNRVSYHRILAVLRFSQETRFLTLPGSNNNLLLLFMSHRGIIKGALNGHFTQRIR